VPYYQISGFGKLTGLKRSRTYFGENLGDALQKAYDDKMVVDIAAVKEVSGDAASDEQKDFCNKLGIRYPKDISKEKMAALIDESLADPVIQARYENLSDEQEHFTFSRVRNCNARSRIKDVAPENPVIRALKLKP